MNINCILLLLKAFSFPKKGIKGIIYIMESQNNESQSITKKKLSAKKIAIYIAFAIPFTLGIIIFALSIWYKKNYGISFNELLYTVISPLAGTESGVVTSIILCIVASATVAIVIFAVIAKLLSRSGVKFFRLRCIGAVLSFVIFFESIYCAYSVLGIGEYLKLITQKTTLYEDYYVSPDSITIGANGETKNLIFIYLESMETTYASKEVGGKQESVNYIPLLTQLALENISFSDKSEGLLGGFHSPTGTTWTSGAIFATSSGLPFAFPIADVNSMDQHTSYASGAITLGDLLEEFGYNQEFICGSKSEFGGRNLFYTQHGNYDIFDLYTAREEGYIDPNYWVWWGYEDMYLYEIAKNEALELASKDEPFNLTILTVDTHATDGYICSLCGDEYSDKLGNVLSCADKQIYEFVQWCMEQDFYEDTAIVIIGDHPRMDTSLVSGVNDYDRTIYNCFINAAVEPSGATTERVMTTMDIFPTVLSAMGFTIEGEQLGLGINLFSNQPTLAEQLGYSYLNNELSKYSEYYVKTFA